MADDYPIEHDQIYQQERGPDTTEGRHREDGFSGREHHGRDRYEREPPRGYDRRRDERGRDDRGRDDDRRRERIDDRHDRGPPGGREYSDREDERRRDRGDGWHDRGPPGGRDFRDDRRDMRPDSREYGRDRRRSRSRDRPRRSRSRDHYDSRRDDRYRDRERDRDGGGGGSRGGGGGRGGGRRGDGSDEEEGYGGYKPRRRQAPPDPSKYDKPLPPGAGPGYIQDPYYYLRQNVPTDPAQAQRLWLEQQLRSRQMVLQQQAASAAAASAKTQRELYIGNLVPGAVTDVALKQLFNTTLAAAFPVAGGSEAVVHVNLHSEGRYAFVEFRSSEMATAALALNGQVQLLGQTISVGRPSGYVDPNKASAAAQAAAQALAAFQAGDMDALAANATAAGMNLAQLGLANLMLPKPAEGAAAATGTEAAAAAAATAKEPTPPPAAAPAAAPTAAGGATEANGGHAANGAAAAAAAAAPSVFFCVHNMLSWDLLADDEEYESVLRGRTAAAHTQPGSASAPAAASCDRHRRQRRRQPPCQRPPIGGFRP